MPDPAGQYFSPYAYAGNSPLVYVDPNGELAWFVPILIGAAIGGGINVAQNWDHIKDFGDALNFFGVGFASGASSFIPGVGGVVAGAISGAGNAALTGGDIGQGIFLGGITGGVGGLGGKLASKLGGNITINGTSLSSIRSPFIRGLFGGALGGFGSAFSAGFVGTLATGGDFRTALSVGLSSGGSGALMAAPIGAGAASVQARKMGLNPLTGKPNNQSTVPSIRFTISVDELRYDPRIAEQTDLYHDFPRLFDREIIENGALSLRISDRAYWFELPGGINSVEGMYRIGMNQRNVIFHRDFVPLRNYQWQFRLRK